MAMAMAMAQPAISATSSATLATSHVSFQPFFYNIVLPDSAPIEEAVRYVLLSRGKLDQSGKICQSITNQTGATSAGDLRRLTDFDWRTLELPAICRIYLKHLIRQSNRGPLVKSNANGVAAAASIASSSSAVPPTPTAAAIPDPFLVALQNDFNFGGAFDLSLYVTNLQMLQSMGFTHKQALEALVMTENTGVDHALEILFSDPQTQKKKRDDAVTRLGRRVDPSLLAHSQNGAVDAQTIKSLTNENQTLKDGITSEKKAREKAERDLVAMKETLPRTIYKEFVHGLIADELISIEEYEQLKQMRETLKISDDMHLLILNELGLTHNKFEAMKKFHHAKSKGDLDCVVCLDQPKHILLMPCAHLCVCEGCLDTVVMKDKKAPKCPICQKRVERTQKIFLS